MNIAEFITHLESAIDSPVGSISAGQALSDILEWDSLAVVSFIALADAKYGKKVSPAALKDCKTVDDLAALVA
ncbi:MAG: acyl carrier protein [Verrucomicrobiaceae bacterium]|nr:acyl carrier protein [Verrucomicrobiaceae bacterium]